MLCNSSPPQTGLSADYSITWNQRRGWRKKALTFRGGCTNEVRVASRQNNMVIHLKSLRISCCRGRLHPPMFFQPGEPGVLCRGDIIQINLGKVYSRRYCRFLCSWQRRCCPSESDLLRQLLWKEFFSQPFICVIYLLQFYGLFKCAAS